MICISIYMRIFQMMFAVTSFMLICTLSLSLYIYIYIYIYICTCEKDACIVDKCISTQSCGLQEYDTNLLMYIGTFLE